MKKIILCIATALVAIGSFFGLRLLSHQKFRTFNPLQSSRLFIDPHSNAAMQASLLRQSLPQKASNMDKLAILPTSKWLESAQSLAELPDYLSAAKSADATATLVVYDLPLRDCGNYSSGGAASAADYTHFTQVVASDIGNATVIIILEPDALAGLACAKDLKTYYALLNNAVRRFKALAHTTVYIDGGNSDWVKDTAVMASRLRAAGIKNADGFSLNVSNFQPTDESIVYGRAISSRLGGAHFVIDTSRNGLGAYIDKNYTDFEWCNPPGRALGHVPTPYTGNQVVDAFLYIKNPGESDGADTDPKKCFEGPVAGTWWPDYAEGLLERWPQELKQ